MIRVSILAVGLLFISLNGWAQTLDEHKTAQYFETIKQDKNKKKLTDFLYAMPKGGDLHSHLTGSSMAENMLEYAKDDALCVNQKTFSLSEDLSCTRESRLDYVKKNPVLLNNLIDSWSMRNFRAGKESGHDHFFAAFGKFYPISKKYTAEILSEIIERAGSQNEIYLELMVSPDGGAAALLGKKVGWHADLAVMREKLLQAGIVNVVAEMSAKLSEDEEKSASLLQCGTLSEKKGCQVTVRYLYQGKREQSPEQVFAQLLLGFEAASRDARIVGLNLVQPEDGKVSMQDYDLHMEMIGFLHRLYPKVNISLHAGELAPGLVPDEGLGVHVGKAVRIAQADRIGHGVDVAHEKQVEQLLEEMAKKSILVEINLSSNAAILGVKRAAHPMPLYMRYNVPVALSTDDEGILRTNLTEQYHVAVGYYHFTYQEVKNLARNSVAYSFLPGQALWDDKNYQQMNAACAKDKAALSTISANCQSFLQANEKANMQWKLEKQFGEFERQF